MGRLSHIGTRDRGSICRTGSSRIWSTSRGEAWAGIFAPVLLRPPEESGEEIVSLAGPGRLDVRGHRRLRAANMTFSLCYRPLVVLLGFVRTARERVTVAELLVPVSLVITVFWPFWSFRFVVPLAPFLYFYFVTGLTLSSAFPCPCRSAHGDRPERLRSRAVMSSQPRDRNARAA